MPLNLGVYNIMGVPGVRQKDLSEIQYENERIRGARMGNDIDQYKFNAMKREEEDDAIIRKTYQEVGGNPDMLVNALYAKGMVKQADAVKKQMMASRETETKIRKEQADAQAKEYETKSKAFSNMRSHIASVLTKENPTHDDAMQTIQLGVENGIATPQMAQSLAAQIMSTPPQGLKPLLQQWMVGAQTQKDQLDAMMPSWRSTGAKDVATNKLTGKPLEGVAPIQMEWKPGEKEALDERIRSSKASEANTRRGQDLSYRAQSERLGYDKERNSGASKTKMNQADIADFDLTIETVDKVRNHPGLSGAVGATWFPGKRFIQGTNEASFMTALEPLKSQIFLSQIKKMRGQGSLSNAEGMKVESAIASLAIAQSEEEFKKGLDTIQGHMRKLKEYAIQEGGGQGSPDAGKFVPSFTPKKPIPPEVQAKLDNLKANGFTNAQIEGTLKQEGY